MATVQEIDHLYDQSGNILYFKDGTARELLEAAGGLTDFPEGFRILSTVELSPQTYFGGTWEYLYDRHMFEGVHVYTRVRDAE